MSKTIGVVLALKDKCSLQLKAIADKIGITEKEAYKLKKQIKNVSKDLGQGLKTSAQVGSVAIGSVIAGSTALIIKAGEVADRIEDMSQKIGISRKGFQEWDYLTKQNGANVESLQMGFKALTNQIIAANNGNKESVKMFKTLGVSVKDSSGNLKTQEQVFNEIVVALQKMPQGAMKAKYANTLLGRSGLELMPLFNATTEQIERQREEYKKLGIEISDSAIDAGNKFGNSMKKLNRATASVTAALGAKLLPVATDLLNTVIANIQQIKATITPILHGISSAIKFIVENMNSLIGITAGVVATFATFKSIATVISIMQALQTSITAVSTAQGIWNDLMLSNPIRGVTVAIGGLITGVVLLWKNWDKVTAAVKAAFEWIKKVAGYLSPQAVTNIIGNRMLEQKKQRTPKYAIGTSYASGGLSLVGENGPELVSLPRGSSIASADKTQKLLNSNSNITINLNIAGNVIGNREFTNEIMTTMTTELRKVIPA